MSGPDVFDSLLRSMEALVVGCRGGFRPHLRALQFGGAAKLARELTSFLNTGAIHRDKHGEESCLPYLRSLYCPINGHLLKSEWNEPKDISDWFVEMIVDATLSGALVAITSSTRSKLLEHYERDAPVLSEESVERLIRGAKCLDEMDGDSLAEIQLEKITSSVSPQSAQNGVHNRSLTVKLPKAKHQKSQPKQSPASPKLQSPANQSPASSPDSNSGNQTEPSNAVAIKTVRTESPCFGLPSRLSSSCPSLTETGFKRFLMSRNWSLPEEDADRAIMTMSPFEPARQQQQAELQQLEQQQQQEEQPSSMESENSTDYFSLGARPKVKNNFVSEFESMNITNGNVDNLTDNVNGNVDNLTDNVNGNFDMSAEDSSVTNGYIPEPKPVAQNKKTTKRCTHRRSASDTDVNKTVVSYFPLKGAVDESAASQKIPELNEDDYIEGYKEGPSYYPAAPNPSWMSTSTCGSWSELRPPSGGWQCPEPASKEQSLLSYIISGQFSKHQAPLDQDNAHLILAEAVINSGPVGTGASILNGNRSVPTSNLVSGDNTVNASSTTTATPDTLTSINQSRSDVAENDEMGNSIACGNASSVKDGEIAEGGTEVLVIDNTIIKRSGGRFVLHNGNPLHERSAEATAIQLLVRLKDPHLPKASELRYLVSEQDAPQKLLPLPQRFFAFSDQTATASASNSQSAASLDNGNELEENPEEDFRDATELRGNRYWAPPRPQLILKIHKNPSNVRAAVAAQFYFCHDCGVTVEPAFAHTYRYCYYFGKFCCTTCHSNKTHILPANIIQNWDFKEYRVSNFALSVLERLSTDPVFAIRDLNPDLTQRIGKLRIAIEIRDQAIKATRYLVMCRFAQDLIPEFMEFVNLDDPGFLSLKMFCSIKTGAYAKMLKKQVDTAIEHILKCELCVARGFLCEGCHSGEPLFPFQLDEVVQCRDCRSCYHKKCVKNPCSKCVRLKNR